MAVENSRIAQILDEVSDLLEIEGADFFRVRAYRNAARVFRDMSTPAAKVAADPDRKLEDLPGVGKDLARKIETILETGDLPLRLDLMTRHVIRAMENPLVDVIGHSTGRKLNERPPYKINMEDVIAAAARTGTALELNSNPRRLDIDDHNCRAAGEHGVKVVIATDAHGTGELGYMRYGINQARRGWLSREDVLNTLTYRSLITRAR